MIKRAGRRYHRQEAEAYPGCDLTNIINIEHQKFPMNRGTVRVHLSHLFKKVFGKKLTLESKDIIYKFSSLCHRGLSTSLPRAKIVDRKETPIFKTGDLVRIRSLEEIEATFDYGRSYKGCSFMPEMEKYCNTIQRVLAPVERFMDEREFRMKRTRGIILLDGLICHGTARLGRCDRHCFYFWRVEWLEKIEPEKGQGKGQGA